MTTTGGLLFCPKCRSIYRSSVSWCAADGERLEVGDDPLLGRTIAGRYRLVELVGEGAMGRVYRAEHTHLARSFAVKALFGELAADRMMRMRFAREARAASSMAHRNLVTVTDFGATESGLLYLVMDFVAGERLSQYSHQRFPLPHPQVLAIAKQLGEGLAYLHGRGLVHRDLKPDNVIVVEEDDEIVPRILDFGLAISEADPEAARCTEKGMVCGTPCYMAPEHALGRELDHRADLFSFGVILYELLAGTTPFDGASYDVAMLNATATPPSISERAPGIDVPGELEAVVFRLLEKEPDRRFQSAAEVMVALERCAFARECDARDTSELPALAAEVDLGGAAVVARDRHGAELRRAPLPRVAQVVSEDDAKGTSTDDLIRALRPRRAARRVLPAMAMMAAGAIGWAFGGDVLLSGEGGEPQVAPAVFAESHADASSTQALPGSGDLFSDNLVSLVGASGVGRWPAPGSAADGESLEQGSAEVADELSADDVQEAQEAATEAVDLAPAVEPVTTEPGDANEPDSKASDDETGDGAARSRASEANEKAARRAKVRGRRAERRQQRRAKARQARSDDDDEITNAESLNVLTGLYTRTSRDLARLERKNGAKAAVLRRRLFAIPYSEALRSPRLRVESTAALRQLQADIHRALPSAKRETPSDPAEKP